MDRVAFYKSLRRRDSGVFGTSIGADQVRGLEAKLDVWEKYFGNYSLTYLAAALGQSYRETGGLMLPILETHSKRYPCKTRKQAFQRLERAFLKGRLTWVRTRYWLADDSGQIGVGGGDIQLTHRYNYVKADKRLKAAYGINSGLSDDYDQILDPTISALVMFKGMIDGWFTGKKLANYVRANGSLDYYNARSIVNGDKKHIGVEIRAFCKAFEVALRAAGYEVGEKHDTSPAEKTIEGSEIRTSTENTRTRNKRIQSLLNAAGYELKVDGKIGNKTIAAIKIFQVRHDLKVDGIAGENTVEVLNRYNEPDKPTDKQSRSGVAVTAVIVGAGGVGAYLMGLAPTWGEVTRWFGF